MNGAQLIAEMLIAYQVNVIFGVPGDTNVQLYRALDGVQDRLRHVMARDERSAGYMADAYARLTNRLAVVEAPSGAGVMYALPAIAEANSSSVGLMLITSDTPLKYEGRAVITELDCEALLKPITKASYRVKSAARIPDVMRRIIRIAMSGRPGAVHLVVPEDVLHEAVDGTPDLRAEGKCIAFPAYPALPSKEDVDALIRLIRTSKRPLLVAGGGVNRAGAQGPLRALAERIGLPVVTTITGQSSIPDRHPLSMGVIGDNGFHPHANQALMEADLIIYVGSRIGSVVSVGYSFPPRNPSQKIAHIDIDPEILGTNTDNALSIVADAGAALRALLDAAGGDSSVDPRWPDVINAWRSKFWELSRAELEAASVPLRPQRIVSALNARLPEPAIVFADPGTPTPYMSRYLRLSNEKSRFIIPRAFGGLGYAIPAVVGAWCADQTIRPVGLFGDGSLGMCAGELETISRLHVPAILMNFSNGTFGWIKAVQRLNAHNLSYSVDFQNLNAAVIAEAHGIWSRRVTTADELDAALDEAFSSSRPAFLDVVVESIAEHTPPVFSWLRKSGHDPLSMPRGEPLRLAPVQ